MVAGPQKPPKTLRLKLLVRVSIASLQEAVRGAQMQVDQVSLEGLSLDLTGKELMMGYLNRTEDFELPRL